MGMDSGGLVRRARRLRKAIIIKTASANRVGDMGMGQDPGTADAEGVAPDVAGSVGVDEDLHLKLNTSLAVHYHLLKASIPAGSLFHLCPFLPHIRSSISMPPPASRHRRCPHNRPRRSERIQQIIPVQGVYCRQCLTR